MDSLPAMSLGRLEKNLDDWESSSTFSQASFESQLKGFRLTFNVEKRKHLSVRGVWRATVGHKRHDFTKCAPAYVPNVVKKRLKTRGRVES